RPTPNGTKSSPVGPAYGAPGGKPCVVHATRVPLRGSKCSDIDEPLHRGQSSCTGKVVAAQSPHRLPINCGLSSGQVEMVGSIAFCIERSSVQPPLEIMRSPNRTTAFRKSGNRILIVVRG